MSLSPKQKTRLFSVNNWVENVNWPLLRVKRLTFRALAFRQRDWLSCGLCVGFYAENGATLLVGIWWRENKNKLVEWKALVHTVGIKSADLEDKFYIFFNIFSINALLRNLALKHFSV